MQGDLDTGLTEQSVQLNRSDTAPLESGDRTQDFLFSEQMSSPCYWASILLLALAGAYLIRWQFTHPGSYDTPAADPFGICTPPWLVLSAAPAAVILSLGHAVHHALRGRRHWRMVLTSASLILVLACGRLLDAWPW